MSICSELCTGNEMQELVSFWISYDHRYHFYKNQQRSSGIQLINLVVILNSIFGNVQKFERKCYDLIKIKWKFIWSKHTCVRCGDDPRNAKCDMILSPANSDRRSRFSVSIINFLRRAAFRSFSLTYKIVSLDLIYKLFQMPILLLSLVK